jgi:hypothetical protein
MAGKFILGKYYVLAMDGLISDFYSYPYFSRMLVVLFFIDLKISVALELAKDN